MRPAPTGTARSGADHPTTCGTRPHRHRRSAPTVGRSPAPHHRPPGNGHPTVAAWTPSSLRSSSGTRRIERRSRRSGRSGWATQPSSCQRTRSTIAAAANPRSRYHARSLRSPCSVSRTTTSRTHTRPSAASCAASESASRLATNTIVSSCSTGSRTPRRSTIPAADRPPPSGDGRHPRRVDGRAAPSAPNRARTSPASRSANCPNVRRPSRPNRSTRSAEISPSSRNQATGRPSTNRLRCRRERPGRPIRIGLPAGRRSPMPPGRRPHRHRGRAPDASCTIPTIRSAIAWSPPKYRDGPRASETDPTRLDDFEARCHLGDRADDRLESTGVAVGVVIEDQ